MVTTIYTRFISLVIRRPLLILLAVVLSSAGFATGLPRLTVDSDTRAFMPPHDPALAALDHLEDTFGTPYLTRIIIERNDQPQGVYNPETLALIVEITEWLKTRPEFRTDLNSDLRSISTVNDITGDENGMVVEPFLEKPPATQAGAIEVRRAIESNGIYVGLLAGYAGRAASIVVRESEEGSHERAQTYFMLRDKLDEYTRQGRPEKFYITGRPVLEGLFGKYIPEESQRTAPAVVLMLALLLYVSFRSLRGVLIPFFVIACTEVWMLGFLGLWGHPVYTITSILPVLLIAIAVADSIHLMARYYEAQQELGCSDRAAVIRQTMRAMGAPVLMTSLTTAAGFLSMTSAAIVPIKDFGLLAAFAVIAAFLVTITAIPAFLMILPLDGAERIDQRRRGAGRLKRLLLLPARIASEYSAATATAFGVIFVVALFGMLRLTTDSSRVGQFPPWHHLRMASDKDTEHFAGSMTLDVMIETAEADGIKSPELLKRIDRFQRAMEESDIVADTFSIAELIKRMNRVMNEDRPEAETIPDSRDLVAQYLLLYSMSGDPGDFDDLVDYEYRNAHIMVFVREPGTYFARTTVHNAERLAREIFPPKMSPAVTIRLAGEAYSTAHLEHHVNSSQLSTLAICLPTLFLISWMMFGRIALGVLAIAPVSLAVTGVYGAMGYVGLPTDIATTMLGGMTLGIGVDFAIHYLHRYRETIGKLGDPTAAAMKTATTAGRALFYNATVLIGGFIVLLGSRLYPQMKLGGLIATTMAVCCVSTMLLFPAALRYVSFASKDVDEAELQARNDSDDTEMTPAA